MPDVKMQAMARQIARVEMVLLNSLFMVFLGFVLSLISSD